ncbi:MAG TPA: glutamine amidotransferase [Dehalococcoidia bacterium]|nr:glutamine amidotransferase [Dehalococcoidia bacterium]
MSEPELRLAHLYPTLMNIYGDRGNILCLQRRCLARGIGFHVEELGLGDRFGPQSYDVIFIGGAQDSEQRRVAADLIEVKGEDLREDVERGVTVLAVCGGYQLLGKYYRPADGADLIGVGILDAWTEHPGPQAPRFIGNVVLDWHGQTIVGFENHGGRTHLGPGAQPLAQVRRGAGNNGVDGQEGAVYRHVYGTYLHGPLLPKNPRFADHLIELALRRRYPELSLKRLDDTLEERAHAAALRLPR